MKNAEKLEMLHGREKDMIAYIDECKLHNSTLVESATKELESIRKQSSSIMKNFGKSERLHNKYKDALAYVEECKMFHPSSIEGSIKQLESIQRQIQAM